MKNFTLGLLALLLCAVSIPAEIIDSVMYNPARLGQYEKLKVSDKASFKGGVRTQMLTLQSGGAVDVSNEGDYQVLQADIQGSVFLPQTHFAVPHINARGGVAKFVQSGQTSEINTLNGVLPRLKANVLKMNAVTINGTPASDYDNAPVKGFKLGGNDIPAPSADCSGLDWFARVDQNTGLTYQVLGLRACGAAAPDSCVMGAWTGVSAGGTSTCGAQPQKGCVEYAACGTEDKPCSGLQARTTTAEEADHCGSGALTSDCFGGGTGEYGESCRSTLTPNCPSGDVCAVLGAGKSCISKIISSGCGGYDSWSSVNDYSPGGPSDCLEEGYNCTSATTRVEKITCVQGSGYPYYKRTCQ